MSTNTVNPHQGCLLLRRQCINIYARWSIATPCRELLNMSLQLQKYTCFPSATAPSTPTVQTCLLVECCFKMDACWTVDNQSACLPIFCHPILHAHYCGGSISAIPAGVVSHYQPCLLMWCLTITMPSSVVHHYQPCLLVWCLTIGHAVGVVPHIGRACLCGVSLSAVPADVVPHFIKLCLPV